MLVVPQWSPRLAAEGCRVPRWIAPEGFAHYIARPVELPPYPRQVEDECSSDGSSPERVTSDSNGGEITVCGWKGCGAQFSSVSRLSAHVSRYHAQAHRDGLFYCGWNDCSRPNRGFNARYKMLVHVRTHTNERPHTCNQCHKSFSRAENLKIHLRSHSGEKPYVCPYEGCGKAYSNSSDRFKHTRTHTVQKPYFCKVPGCNKRYTDPSSLRKHVKTYKHFTTEDRTRKESSDDLPSPIMSPSRDTSSSYEPSSPLQARVAYSQPSPQSPMIPPYNPVLPEASIPLSMGYTPLVDTYRPLEPIYPMRVPSQEMSYVEYSQMYEHAYRSYYSSMSYPVLRPSAEKVFSYESMETRLDSMSLQSRSESPKKMNVQEEEMPLNLICTRRLECKPIEQLVRRTDLPLDLSTKS